MQEVEDHMLKALVLMQLVIFLMLKALAQKLLRNHHMLPVNIMLKIHMNLGHFGQQKPTIKLAIK
jgi:hypothetical protein